MIDFLVVRRFGKQSAQPNDETAFRAELQRIPFDTIKFRYENEKFGQHREDQVRAARAADERMFLRHVADFNYWVKRLWNLDSATALLLGVDPREVRWEVVQQCVKVSDFAKCYRDLRDIIVDATRAKDIPWFGPVEMRPGDVIEWALARDVHVPLGLTAELQNVIRESNQDVPGPELTGNSVPAAPPVEGFSASSSADDRTGGPGRPTAIHLVIDEFRRRVKSDEAFLTLTAEANHLKAWADQAHKGRAIPKAKTIENNIRAEHLRYRTTPRKPPP